MGNRWRCDAFATVVFVCSEALPAFPEVLSAGRALDPIGRASEHGRRASEEAGRASDQAGWALEPAERASEPAERASEPAEWVFLLGYSWLIYAEHFIIKHTITITIILLYVIKRIIKIKYSET